MRRKSTRKNRTGRPDPAELALFANLFASIAEEMGATLTRTAYSPNIKERRDCSCAVFDGDGRLVAQAAHIPVHLGAMPMSVQAVLAAFDQWHNGDVAMLNDPYAGGTHLPDITLVSPVMAHRVGRAASTRNPNKPFAFLASRAHHADVGGATPGSLPLSRDIYQEGLRIPPVRLCHAGRVNDAVFDLLQANSRTPRERRGDLRAQLAAHQLGATRLREMLEKYGTASVRRRMNDLLGYGRRLMEAVIADIPDGTYTFDDRLDDDGVTADPIPIKVTLTVRGRRATVDFTGSGAACAGSLNAVEAITRSAVYYCFLGLLVTSSSRRSECPVDPPLNAGCFEPLTVVAPPGTIVNAPPPHAVAGGNVETSQRIVDVVLGALARAVPDLIPAASQGTMNNLTLGGIDPRRGQPFAYYETIAGGMGAGPTADGAHGVQVHMTNTMNTPVEALEFAYPLRIERYELVPGTGGRGRRRGGWGVRRDVRLRCDAWGTILSERRRIPPYGLHGGEPGRVGKNILIRDRRPTRLPGKVSLELKEGDILIIQTPGGGGWMSS